MRWILTVVALLGFVTAWATHSPGLLAFGAIVGLVCGIAAALAFADVQIRASSRPEHMTPGELDALKSTLQPRATPGNDQLPPPRPE